MSAFFVAIGVISGNYIYQMLTGHNWNTAYERSYFQAIALLAVWFVERSV